MLESSAGKLFKTDVARARISKRRHESNNKYTQKAAEAWQTQRSAQHSRQVQVYVCPMKIYLVCCVAATRQRGNGVWCIASVALSLCVCSSDSARCIAAIIHLCTHSTFRSRSPSQETQYTTQESTTTIRRFNSNYCFSCDFCPMFVCWLLSIWKFSLFLFRLVSERKIIINKNCALKRILCSWMAHIVHEWPRTISHATKNINKIKLNPKWNMINLCTLHSEERGAIQIHLFRLS